MEELDDFKDFAFQIARGIWRYRWIGISVSSLVLVGGILLVDRIPNSYEAETKVFIDTETVLGPLLKGLAVEADYESTVEMISRQLLSRPNLERAVRLIDMDDYVDGSEGFTRYIDSLQREVSVSAGSRSNSNLYTINYTDTNAVRAKRLVQTLLDILVEDAMGKTDTESDSAIEFLNSQIDKYDRLLQAAEKRLEEFRRKNIGLMPQEGNNYYAELQDVEGTIEQSELLLAELENRRDQIQMQIEAFKLENERPTASVKNELDLRIEDQEKKLDELLLMFTEEHPDVIGTQQILVALRERKKDEIANQTLDSISVLENPVYQQMQILLSETKADISSVSTRVQSAKSKRIELKKLVDVVPRIEADLQRLNRDYEIHRDNYNQFVARREQALISEDVEAGGDQIKFRIIEPPYVPAKPSYPNRPLFDLAAIGVALGSGYGFAFLISLLNPVFSNQKDLVKYVGGSVLGAVSKFDSPDVLSKRRKDILAFGFMNLFILVCAGYLVYIHSTGALISDQIRKGMLIIGQIPGLAA